MKKKLNRQERKELIKRLMLISKGERITKLLKRHWELGKEEDQSKTIKSAREVFK